MNRLRYTHIYTLLFTLGAILASTSCVRDYNTLGCEDDGNKYLTLTLSLAPSGNDGLRMQGDEYSINSDKTNREDYVNDLRIFLIQNGVIKKNASLPNWLRDPHTIIARVQKMKVSAISIKVARLRSPSDSQRRS